MDRGGLTLFPTLELGFQIPQNPPMESLESHDVLKEAIEKKGPKEIAAEMGLSLSLIYKWGQPNTDLGSGSRNPLDRVAQLMELTGELLIIQWLCREAGGHFVRNPPSRCEEGFEVLPATNEIVNQFAGLLAEVTQAAIDNSISPDESARIRKIWDELKMYTEGFVRCCEEGDFEHIPLSDTDEQKRK